MTLREWSDKYEGGVRILRLREGWPPEALVDREGWYAPQWIPLHRVEFGQIKGYPIDPFPLSDDPTGIRNDDES